jgi:calcium/calmodulin-dependent protein kinase (CaM kinase) II
MSLESDRDAVLELTQKLLVAITAGDWNTYADICDESLTCFEPEALGNLVDGLEFHNYYFNLPANGPPTPVQSTIVAPHIRIMGDVAVIAYIRLTQRMNDGKPVSSAMEETRVWHRQQGKWKHVHFHRSPAR